MWRSVTFSPIFYYVGIAGDGSAWGCDDTYPRSAEELYSLLNSASANSYSERHPLSYQFASNEIWNNDDIEMLNILRNIVNGQRCVNHNGQQYEVIDLL